MSCIRGVYVHLKVGIVQEVKVTPTLRKPKMISLSLKLLMKNNLMNF